MRIQASVALAGLMVGLMFGNAVAFAASAEYGKIAYIKNGCWQCHGFVGQGSLVTSGGKVLSNTQLSLDAFTSFVRKSGGVMPPYSEKILPDGDLADIYAYLLSVPKPLDANGIPLLKP